MAKQKTILVAPLHWGLGHATRCIPIIRELLNTCNVIIASDGAALLLLQREFPQLSSIELPSYNITYPKKGEYFKWSLFLKLPHIKKTIASEKKIVKKLVSENTIDGIISDNRFGVHSKKVPSVFITHQLNVLSGKTTYFSSKLHQNIIKKFDECWVPDVEKSPNLSGRLGHINSVNLNLKYIGPLSRMQKMDLVKKYDVLALLSGPEPQRTILEEKLMEEFTEKEVKVLLVQGIVETEQKTDRFKNITVVNFMGTSQLETAINESEVVVSRSGYTTIMDLAILEKKAFFIPTPGQYEQKYLAKRLKGLGLVPFCRQDSFTIKKLDEIAFYKGLKGFNVPNRFDRLFGLFKSE